MNQTLSVASLPMKTHPLLARSFPLNSKLFCMVLLACLTSYAAPKTDVDKDGMPDEWEASHGLDPQVNDGNADKDGDGLSNMEEFKLGLNPGNPDSDGDGLFDGDEATLGRDPKVPGPDKNPPTAPTGLRIVKTKPDSISLAWKPAKDDLKVSGYLVYRDGQPVETKAPIRGTTFIDENLPDDEEFSYQVRAFDYAGNLSPLSEEISGATNELRTKRDGMSDEWKNKYFFEENPLPNEDADGDGMTNLQEFKAKTNPRDFFNGVKPVLEPLYGGQEGPDRDLVTIVRKPNGKPWPNAPVQFDSSLRSRRMSVSKTGPFRDYQLEARANADGRAVVYLEPLDEARR